MGDIIKISEIIRNNDLLTSLLVVFGCAFFISFIIKTIYGWVTIYYNKRHGIETKDENINNSIKELRQVINDLKELHEEDIKELKDKEKEDIAQIKESVKEINKMIQDTNTKMDILSERDQHTNQAILRNDIIRTYKDIQANNMYVSPREKENMDELFESYFKNNGNGTIKDLKADYDANIVVDYYRL